MRCAFAVVAVALLVAGCDGEQQAEEQENNGQSLQEQYQKQMRSELDKIQSEIDRKTQKNIKTGQEALESAKPKVVRSDKEKELPERSGLRSSRDNSSWRSGH